MRSQCPECNKRGEDRSGNNLYSYPSGDQHCFKCNYHVHADGKITEVEENKRLSIDVGQIKQYSIRSLTHKPIRLEVCERYSVRVGVREEDGEIDTVYYPYYSDGEIISYKVRKLPKDFYVVGKPKQATLFGIQSIRKGGKLLVITEGEDDCLAAYQMLLDLGKNYNVVSIANGANEQGNIDNNVKQAIGTFKQFDNVVVCFDMDNPGRELAKGLANFLSPFTKVRVMDLPLKDAGEMLVASRGEEFWQCLCKASEFRAEGVIAGSDIKYDELFKPMQEGYSIPYPILQRKIHGLRKGELVTLTAGCVDSDTEYFTGEGWRRIAEYNGGNVGVIDNEHTLKLEVPIRYIKAEEDKLYHIHTKYGIDMCLSAEHEVIYNTVDLPHKFNKLPLTEVMNRHNRQVTGFRGRIPTTFKVNNTGDFSLTPEQVRVMVAVIGDGHFPSVTNRCYIRIKKGRKKERIVRLLNDAGIDFTSREVAPYDGFECFTFYAPIRTKVFEAVWYSAPSDVLATVAEECLYWDGDQRHQFFSRCKASADFIQYAMSSTGRRASLYGYQRDDGVDYVVSSTHRKDISFRKTSTSQPEFKEYKPKDGYKYCFTTSTGMLLLRRNGNIFITGNSGIGKSTLAREIAYHLVKEHKLSIANIFLEEQYLKTALGYIAIDHNVPLPMLRVNPSLIPEEDKRRSFDELIAGDKNHFFNHFGSLESDDLIDRLRYYAYACGVDFILLDHLSLVISGQESGNERRSIDLLMTKLAAFVNETGTGVIAVCHLKRPSSGSYTEGKQVSLSDLRGSAALEQLSWCVIGMERDQQDEENSDFSTIRVLKNREHGHLGVADNLFFNAETGRLKAHVSEQSM